MDDDAYHQRDMLDMREAAIYDLLDKVSACPGLDPDYVDKMVHKIPRAPVFNRVDYLLKAVEGKVVLDLGASGPAALRLQKAAKEYHGVDWELNDEIENFYQLDIESLLSLPDIPGLELIIAGEVIEHLSNAGRFLCLLYASGVPVILTTPNARSIAGYKWGDKGTECVNRDHVAWYSYHTLKTLIERHGFELRFWGWYNGEPYTAEGLIFHMGVMDSG